MKRRSRCHTGSKKVGNAKNMVQKHKSNIVFGSPRFEYPFKSGRRINGPRSKSLPAQQHKEEKNKLQDKNDKTGQNPEKDNNLIYVLPVHNNVIRRSPNHLAQTERSDIGRIGIRMRRRKNANRVIDHGNQKRQIPETRPAKLSSARQNTRQQEIFCHLFRRNLFRKRCH